LDIGSTKLEASSKSIYPTKPALNDLPSRDTESERPELEHV